MASRGAPGVGRPPRRRIASCCAHGSGRSPLSYGHAETAVHMEVAASMAQYAVVFLALRMHQGHHAFGRLHFGILAELMKITGMRLGAVMMIWNWVHGICSRYRLPRV